MRCTFYAPDAKSGERLWSHETGHWIRSQPAVANGVVYFGSFDDYFYGLDTATGAELFKFKAGSAVPSGPAVVDGMVYMTSWDGSVYAFGPAH